MQVDDLLHTLDRLAPFSLAEPWDNCGLLVGDGSEAVGSILLALDLTSEVLQEALAGGFGTIVTHHPAIFSPLQRLLESDPRAALLRSVVRSDINVVSCHTNLDSAEGGLADIAGAALGLQGMVPIKTAPAGWYKFVGFVPPESLALVSEAVFAAGAGTIGDYSECAYASEGEGSFRPQAGAQPTVGRVGQSERLPEVRWETIVPRARLDSILRAFVASHPYEEPAFDIYPVEDRLPRVGLGRVGDLPDPVSVDALARTAAQVFELGLPLIGGDTTNHVRRVAVLPGGGRSLLVEAARVADVLVTGDLGYHDAEQARELGMALICLPHGDLEWAAMRRWADSLRAELAADSVMVMLSREWRSPWRAVAGEGTSMPASSGEQNPRNRPRQSASAPASNPKFKPRRLHLWIDGGSRGNPGPSAIGVVLKDDAGTTLEEVGRIIAPGTNNAAEYQALLEGLDMASRHEGAQLEINSDSELLVKQMLGEYRVKNETLRELFAEAKLRASDFDSCVIRHVPRENNVRADELLNQALDEAVGKKNKSGSSSSSGGSASLGLF